MKTTIRPAVAALCILFASAAYGSGAGKCIPVHGFIQSTPAATCDQVDADNKAWLLLVTEGIEAPDPLLKDIIPNVPAGDVCLDVKGFGVAQFHGSSGLTAVQVGNWTPDRTYFFPLATPLTTPPYPTASPINPFGTTLLSFGSGVRSTLNIFTSQAVLVGKLHGLEGTLYTKDTGVITPVSATALMVGQVLKIVGGTDGFEGASGTIAVAGEEVGGRASYTGEVCPGKSGKPSKPGKPGKPGK